ncbi:MAG: hypothetical protein DKM22_04205 [Candidatus Melainabacteria bacterium]|nr:MAG: hypothetical protein DKM22_04205 [Candidatus Melainabacteria bacterium]
MAKVLCAMADCKYCGRKSNYELKDHTPLYNCKRKTTVIYEPLDWDNEYFENRGHKEASCIYYETSEDTIVYL